MAIRPAHWHSAAGWLLAAGMGCGGDSGAGDADADTSADVSSTSTSATTSSETSASDPSTSSGDSTEGSGSEASSGGPSGSAGCGIADPPSGMLTMDVEGQQGDYIVSIPAAYDPDNPYPVGFAFHGRNRTGPNCQDGDCAGFQSVMEDQAVLVYMTSMGGTGWEGDTERELNVTFFEQVLVQLAAGYCIDESRVFVAGTSSGAHFANVLGCRFGDRLVATAPVAGYLPETDCVGQLAALVIHGVDDYHVEFSSGEAARNFWRMRNGCSNETIPTIAEVHADVVKNAETHGCAAYQGCDRGVPVVWCEHSEGGYDGSTHGWPLFGGQEIWDFVAPL